MDIGSSIDNRYVYNLCYVSALRSIGLKCMEHLFFINIIGDSGRQDIDAHLFDLLEGAFKN